MNPLDRLPRRARLLTGHAGERLGPATSHTGRLLQAAASLGVLRGGAKLARAAVRRNPVLVVAAGLGAGLFVLAAYRQRKLAQMQGSTEGRPRRIDARRVEGTGKPLSTPDSRS